MWWPHRCAKWYSFSNYRLNCVLCELSVGLLVAIIVFSRPFMACSFVCPISVYFRFVFRVICIKIAIVGVTFAYGGWFIMRLNGDALSCRQYEHASDGARHGWTCRIAANWSWQKKAGNLPWNRSIAILEACPMKPIRSCGKRFSEQWADGAPAAMRSFKLRSRSI